jgi:acyl carrier protein
MSERDAVSVEGHVLEIVAEVLGEAAERLRAEHVLADYEWDSIGSLEALAQLESRLDITLDLREFHAARTIGELMSLVERAADARRRTPAP